VLCTKPVGRTGSSASRRHCPHNGTDAALRFGLRAR
jgi:hypothetical protein